MQVLHLQTSLVCPVCKPLCNTLFWPFFVVFALFSTIFYALILSEAFTAFLKHWKCSILSHQGHNSNLYIKNRVSFEISRRAGNFEHRAFFKKSPTRGGKTMLNDFAPPSRIFGLAFKLKKSSEKKSGIFLNLLQSWRGVRNYPLLR